MAFTWGDTTLRVIYGSWSPAQVSSGITEAKLIPNPTDLSAICTVILQAGTSRERVSATLLFLDIDEYIAMKDDMVAGTERTLVGDGVNAQYYIESLSLAQRDTPHWLIADITFVEA